MFHTVTLIPRFTHRYKIEAYTFNIRDKKFEGVTIMLDTGCFNTMVPRYVAETAGRPLGFKRTYNLGANELVADAYSIGQLKIGDTILERVTVFAADYPGEYADNIILGANVMNNWKMLLNKRENIFQFEENPPDNLPNKTNIYQNYFAPDGKYMAVQDVG